MSTNNLSSSDFFAWINSQPDEKEINMAEPYRNSPCGCLLVQYGRHLNLDFPRVGFASIGRYTFDNKPDTWRFIVRLCDETKTNFGFAKEILSQIIPETSVNSPDKS